MKLSCCCLCLFMLFAVPKLTAQSTQEELKTLTDSIQSILATTKTPAVGIAMVKGDSVLLATSFGTANIENQISAHQETMFRIGSVSKMFVSLAILKLQEEGKIHLKDQLRELAPEIEHINQWEKTHPILVEHLLEHTTGWDDMHFTDYAHGSATTTLKEGLDFHPHSRNSRWVPGTRTAYCNAGPAAAAYLVEKVTGKAFEAYIKTAFFDPMGMQSMTFFESDQYKKFGATLYQYGKPQAYWHISVRPTGSINSSPADMANMLKFFINRGTINGKQLLSEQALVRMETPKTSDGAKAGLTSNYALSNYDSPFEEFVYRGHNGGVPGGLSELAYLPDHQVGYAFMINTRNPEAFQRISNLIKAFQVKGLTKRNTTGKALKTDKHISNDKLNSLDSNGGHDGLDGPANTDYHADDLSGYYFIINPRLAYRYFLDRILSIQKLTHQGDSLFSKSIFNEYQVLSIAVDDHQYASPETGQVNLVVTHDPIAGKVINGFMTTLQRIPTLVFYFMMSFIVIWCMVLISSLSLGIWKLVLFAIGRLKKGTVFYFYFWPFISALVLFGAVTPIVLSGNKDAFHAFGIISPFSLSVFMCSIAFAVSSSWNLLYVIKHRNMYSMHKLIYGYTLVVSLSHFMMTCYLAYHHVIGIRLWA